MSEETVSCKHQDKMWNTKTGCGLVFIPPSNTGRKWTWVSETGMNLNVTSRKSFWKDSVMFHALEDLRQMSQTCQYEENPVTSFPLWDQDDRFCLSWMLEVVSIHLFLCDGSRGDNGGWEQAAGNKLCFGASVPVSKGVWWIHLCVNDYTGTNMIISDVVNMQSVRCLSDR